MALGEAASHHVGDAQGLHSQQVEYHGVGEAELRLQHGGLALGKRGAQNSPTTSASARPHSSSATEMAAPQVVMATKLSSTNPPGNFVIVESRFCVPSIYI